MAPIVQNVVLNNGNKIPIIGLGTWDNFKSPEGEVAQAIKHAIDAGYRHIDAAHVYGNEHEIGQAVNDKIAEGVIKREDIFITSKLWNTFHRPELVRGALEVTLKSLNTPYVDLYLIHWPFAWKEGNGLFPRNDDGKIQYSDADFLDTWKELEKAVDEGLIKNIGLSNFNRAQIERLLAVARILPVTNQVEAHPYLNQKRLSAYCASKNITITGYSPLGSPGRSWAKPDEPILLDDPKLIALAAKYGKTVGQLLIRFQVQLGYIVVPKSQDQKRIISNLDVFDFELSAADMELINTFDCNGRINPFSECKDHPNYPFDDEY